MTVEEKLQEYILQRYPSYRAFAIAIDMSATTLYSIFERGVFKANIESIAKICDDLDISMDALVKGSIVPRRKLQQNP